MERMYHSVPGGSYLCKDGEWIYIATGLVQRLMQQLSQAIGRPELAEDPRFATQEARMAHRKELYETFREAFLEKTSDEWLQLAKEIDFAAVKMTHFADLAEDPQAIANDYVEKVTFRNGRVDVMPRSPFHMETLPELQTIPAPKIGGDTVEILSEYGYSDAEIEALLEEQIVRKAD